jgi:hypothetical protein
MPGEGVVVHGLPPSYSLTSWLPATYAQLVPAFAGLTNSALDLVGPFTDQVGGIEHDGERLPTRAVGGAS